MAGGNRKETKQKRPKRGRDDPAQSERFIQAAKSLTGETGEAFEKAMGAILKPKKKSRSRDS